MIIPMYPKRTILLLVFLCGILASYAQNIVRAEYIIDEDPGTGKGKALTIIAGTTININDSIAVNTLSPGFHTLLIRTKSATGPWSFFARRSFYISADSAANAVLPVISKAEYFIDKDPGAGKGKSIKVNPSDTSISFSDSMAVSALQPGFHILSIRTKNSYGRWSSCKSKMFFIAGDTTNNAVLPAIKRAEYFIDEDPGAGKGKAMAINASGTGAIFKDSASVSTLKTGFHNLSIRVKNAEGPWSLVRKSSFYVSADTSNDAPPSFITRGEYFIDKDPGTGKGKALSVNKADTAQSFVDSALTTTYLPGNHTLSIRTKNAAGRWGGIKSSTFFVPGDSTDDDKDGLAVFEEELIYGTDPKDMDSNDDGLADGVNVFVGLKPKATDTDGDGISNVQEIINGTSPILADTDQDGVPDNIDAFPLDGTRTILPPPNTSDHTSPVITLLEPF